MKILILSWRDTKNPRGGGAEFITHQCAKYWVKRGNKVTLFTSSFPGYRRNETIDGVEIIREGLEINVAWRAFKYYRKNFRNKLDIIVDEINAVPFFTPLYASEKKVAFIHQLAREIWWYEANFPINLLGYLSESTFLKLYRKIPTITISNSTKSCLLDLGFKDENIFIIPKCIKHSFQEGLVDVIKEKNPTIIYVGRIKKSKRVDHCIKALINVKKELPSAKLWIVGDGDDKYIRYLKDNVLVNNLENEVIFFGRLNDYEKFKLMRKAHIIIVASVREGWGLIVTEANSVGTPAVVYDVPGLRDSVKDKVTGLICEKNSIKNLASNIIRLLKDDSYRKKLSENALKWSKNFVCEETGRVSLEILKNFI